MNKYNVTMKNGLAGVNVERSVKLLSGNTVRKNIHITKGALIDSILNVNINDPRFITAMDMIKEIDQAIKT